MSFFLSQSYALYSKTYFSIIEFYLLALFSCFIIIIAYKAMNNPSFLHFELVKKYKNSKLNESELQSLELRLKEIMENEKPYLNTDLKLKHLSEKLSTTENILSQVFSQKMNITFYDYINNYRLDEFLNRSNNFKYDNYTIESIALDSGFKHKTVFYKYFKQRFHMNPKEYLKTL
jgi:AraC-like DNA-binding protein